MIKRTVSSIIAALFISSQTYAVCTLPNCQSTEAAQTNVQAAAGSNSSVAIGIQGVSGGVPIPVSGAGGGSQYAEAATTTPATGTVALCRYLSGGNTLTNTQLWGLACDSANNLLVSDSRIPSKGQATMANSLPIAIASNQSTLPFREIPFKNIQNFTRPSNTTAYVIGYAISNATSSPTQLTFPVCTSASQYGIIEKVTITSTNKGSPLPQISAYVFGSTLSGATFNDGAALEVDTTTYETIGAVIPLVETSNTNAKSRTTATSLNIPFQCDSSSNLYVILQALNAYVPASAEVLYVALEGKLR